MFSSDEENSDFCRFLGHRREITSYSREEVLDISQTQYGKKTETWIDIFLLTKFQKKETNNKKKYK